MTNLEFIQIKKILLSIFLKDITIGMLVIIFFLVILSDISHSLEWGLQTKDISMYVSITSLYLLRLIINYWGKEKKLNKLYKNRIDAEKAIKQLGLLPEEEK